MKDLFSLQIEKHVLGGLLKHPAVFSEVDGFIIEYDFHSKAHSTIFCVMRGILSNAGVLDKVVLAQKVRELGLSFKDDVNIFDYIDNLSFTQITPKATIEACQSLVTLRVRRELNENADEVKAFIQASGDKTIDEVVSGVDAIYNKKIITYSRDLGPQDLYAGIKPLIELRASHPREEVGVTTAFKDFNRAFGGLRSGNGIYTVVSRAKHGKSTWLLNLAQGCVALNEGLKVLILDTEMSTEVSQYRACSAITQVPMWYLETGNWQRNLELRRKIENELKTEPLHGKVYHINVSGRSIEEVCSIARRWYYKMVGRDKPAIIIYDYIKLTNERISDSWKEYQVIGEKVNLLNELGNKLNVPIWAAMQQNRTAEQGLDDSSTIALSDRLTWFANFVGIFRRKTLNEIAEFGIESGSHLLKPVVSRFQGKDGAGHHDVVRIPLGNDKFRYADNFINYDISNFKVTEKGTLKDWVDLHHGRVDLGNDNEHDANEGAIL